MPYLQGQDRNQMMMCSMDSFVAEDSIARLIDAFVDSLDLSSIGINRTESSIEGRPAYDPRILLKLYVYGYESGTRSSRKLMALCQLNLEVRWLMNGLEPDFRTISDFRKDNIKSMKKVFYEFNRRISGAVEWGFTSVDGSKFQASNSKDNNFTKNKLDDRIKWLNAHTDEYMRQLAENDENEELFGELTREELEKKLTEAQERLKRYEGYRELMEQTGASQLSIVDADARLMKNKNGFTVSYNPQTAVDSETHLIRDYQMTNQVTDHGLLHSTMEGIAAENSGKVIDVIADKGYENTDDMLKCLENGIIPHVIMDDGKDSYDFEIPYQEDSVDKQSVDPEELKKCLHAGVIPEAYKAVIPEMEVKEARRLIKDEEIPVLEAKSPYGTPEEMQTRAKEGFFVRDPERNLVYCPAGEVLRQKCIKANGNIRYANKNACRHCKHRDKCYKGKNEWKEIDFTKDKLEKPCKDWLKAEGRESEIEKGVRRKGHWEKVKVVRFKLKPDKKKMSQRLNLSEHPFGTMKRALGSDHFLLRGLEKAAGEFALLCMGYNLKRSKSLLGFSRMMKVMVNG